MHKKILAALVLVASVLLHPLYASAADAIATMPLASLNAWMKDYYRHPEPERISAFIDRVAADGFFRDEWTYPPIAGFLSGAQRQHPALASVILEHAKTLPDYEQQAVLATLVWGSTAGTPARDAAFAAIGKRMEFMDWGMRSGIVDVDMVVVTDGNGLDFLWGAFFATGDVRVLTPLLGVLPNVRREDDKVAQAIALGAMWGLASNGVEHEAVREYCRAQSQQQPEKLAYILRDIVRKSEGGYSDTIRPFTPLAPKSQ